MTSEKDKKVATLRNAIPTIPATGSELKALSIALTCALEGTELKVLTQQILLDHVPNKAKTGREFSEQDANYLYVLVDYLDSLIYLSDACLKTYKMFEIK
ncbi:hypothetical protein ACNFBR_10205 [Pseudomonas sp. NY11955]|uniref:hypothetical protein n=1 Tax=Pseudomonas sp. NY11955 TaxID=3400363 RepID=UPI003A8AB32D